MVATILIIAFIIFAAVVLGTAAVLDNEAKAKKKIPTRKVYTTTNTKKNKDFTEPPTKPKETLRDFF